MTRSGSQLVGARPEVELLLLCARPRMGSERAARVETLLQEDINWDYLLKTAQEHGLMPLLYWNLNATCPEAVPKAAFNQLRHRFRKNAQRSVFWAGELLRLLNLFETHGISAVPFKGPSLAASIYGNLALRQFGDLDILVREQDVLKAKDLLLSQGYRSEYKHKENRRQEKAVLRSWGEYPFMHDSNGLRVDLHWKIGPEYFSFPLKPERLWERLEPTSLAGKEVLALSPEDLLLILCMHGTKHLWQALELICAVGEMIRVSEGLNWARIMEQARELGGERMLFLGLFLASNLLGATPPDEVLQRALADPPVRALAAQVRGQLFREADNPPNIFEEALFYLRARERLYHRVRYCIRRTLTPTSKDWMLPLPASLFFLYYLLRPARLIGEHRMGLLRGGIGLLRTPK
jgi:hypothetical protein